MFDIVFMDPPYNKNLVNISVMNLYHSGKMSPNALIVIEHSINERIDLNHPSLLLADQRKYGKTLISFLTYN
jgi:16S rRNA (guanine966-N2)-methyltransferase